jgi:hypothetical protein
MDIFAPVNGSTPNGAAIDRAEIVSNNSMEPVTLFVNWYENESAYNNQVQDTGESFNDSKRMVSATYEFSGTNLEQSSNPDVRLTPSSSLFPDDDNDGLVNYKELQLGSDFEEIDDPVITGQEGNNDFSNDLLSGVANLDVNFQDGSICDDRATFNNSSLNEFELVGSNGTLTTVHNNEFICVEVDLAAETANNLYFTWLMSNRSTAVSYTVAANSVAGEVAPESSNGVNPDLFDATLFEGGILVFSAELDALGTTSPGLVRCEADVSDNPPADGDGTSYNVLLQRYEEPSNDLMAPDNDEVDSPAAGGHANTETVLLFNGRPVTNETIVIECQDILLSFSTNDVPFTNVNWIVTRGQTANGAQIINALDGDGKMVLDSYVVVPVSDSINDIRSLNCPNMSQ